MKPHIKTTTHCLTFDLEEHFQVSAFDSPIRRRHWNTYESRVEQNTEKLLEILETHQIRATFFILGWVAERHRAMIRRIAGAGHEIASHGYAHELVPNQTPDQFREDVRKAKMILEDIVGTAVLGYRAPSFTVTSETSWALEILAEAEYVYDSSVFPIRHDRYGWPGATPSWQHHPTRAGVIWEIPLSTAKVGFWRIPIAGGGYLRLYPYPLMRYLLNREAESGTPLVMYVHPWELDPEQPRMQGPWLSRFRHYVNLHKTEERLIQLLKDFSYCPIQEVLKGYRERNGDESMALNGYCYNQSG